MVFLLMKMAEYIQVNIKTMKKTDLEYTDGLMEKSMKANGPMENKMVKPSIQIRVASPVKDSGETENV